MISRTALAAVEELNETGASAQTADVFADQRLNKRTLDYSAML